VVFVICLCSYAGINGEQRSWIKSLECNLALDGKVKFYHRIIKCLIEANVSMNGYKLINEDVKGYHQCTLAHFCALILCDY